MEVNREEYIQKHSMSLLKMSRQKKNIKNRLLNSVQMSVKCVGRLNAEYSFLLMEINKTEERIGFALGILSLTELREIYEPTGWQEYQGIKGEMENLKFEQ